MRSLIGAIAVQMGGARMVISRLQWSLFLFGLVGISTGAWAEDVTKIPDPQSLIALPEGYDIASLRRGSPTFAVPPQKRRDGLAETGENGITLSVQKPDDG